MSYYVENADCEADEIETDPNLVAFRSLYAQGYARVAAVCPELILADPHANAQNIGLLAERLSADGVSLAVLPEMSLTGYSLGDLVFQESLLNETEAALDHLIARSHAWSCVLVVGAPLRCDGALYNCAAVICRGRLLGVVPKSHLPNHGEFYDGRYYVSGADTGGTIEIAGRTVPFGADILFKADNLANFVLGFEVCEDLWVPNPPSTRLALAGATIIGNLSASPARAGRAEKRSALCKEQSRRLECAYVYSSAGRGESGTDLVWDGQCAIFECGEELKAQSVDSACGTYTLTEIDLTKVAQLRAKGGYFGKESGLRTISFELPYPKTDIGFYRIYERFPFLPASQDGAIKNALEILDLQARALARRVRAVGAQSLIIGVSGGLDSAWALLACVMAASKLEWKMRRVTARTLPGFTTREDTLDSAASLMAELGVDDGIIETHSIVHALLSAVDHPAGRLTEADIRKMVESASEFETGAGSNFDHLFDTTFENVQAGARTDLLFRLANQKKGLVVGTGDLSETALGWCTYGVGDQMAHYNINAGLPKTLIQQALQALIEVPPETSLPAELDDILGNGAIRDILTSIVERPISPELLPTRRGQGQETQKSIGPYCLQDFTLYNVLRFGFTPSRLAFMLEKTWGIEGTGAWPQIAPPIPQASYSFEEIVYWLGCFTDRFYSFAQFKRSAMPDGPKLLEAGSLSPRGDWRAPSDLGRHGFWRRDLERLKALET